MPYPRRRYHPIIYRTHFAKEIIAEVALPERQTGKVIVLAQGLPAVPHKRSALEFLVGEGYAVVYPRYRGTWESAGYFLDRSPTEDIRDVITSLARSQKFWCIFSQGWVSIRVQSIFIIASSFGGPAGIAMSALPIVKKVALLSPVLDWHYEGEDESFHEFIRFTQEGFGMATRLSSPKNWQKLRSDPTFYSFSQLLKPIEQKKILLIHCVDDMIVPIEPALKAVAERRISNAYFKPHGGHLGTGHIQQLFFWNKVKRFFNAK